MSESLWGNLESLLKKNTPKTILVEQANHLQRASNGLLVVKVDSQGDIKGEIVHRMNVYVPALNHYKYKLLSVSHKLSIYPLTINHPIEGVDIPDEQQFEVELGKIFKSKPVRRALEALLLQARDMQNDNDDDDASEEHSGMADEGHSGKAVDKVTNGTTHASALV